jgi:hypothetical protein
MLNVFEHELMQEQSQSVSNKQNDGDGVVIKNFSESTKNLPHLPDSLINVDIQKVRESILFWHNKERNNI